MGTEDKIKLLKQYVEESSAIVFFGGAGVSTESGIPDFRSVDGLYHQEWKYPPETIISHSFFVRNPEEFYRFYRKKLLCPDAKPNAAHKKLAELEATGKLNAVVTQNIDGIIKPDVVLYEEGLDDATLRGAVRAISQADMLIIGGTSLAVYPAAGLIDYFTGKHLVVINRDATPRDAGADLLIQGNIGEVLSGI